MGRYSLVLEEASMDYEVGVTGAIVTPLWRALFREEAASETPRGRGMWVCWDWDVPQATILSPAPGKPLYTFCLKGFDYSIYLT